MLNKIWSFLKRSPLRRLVALAFAVFLYMHLPRINAQCLYENSEKRHDTSDNRQVHSLGER